MVAFSGSSTQLGGQILYCENPCLGPRPAAGRAGRWHLERLVVWCTGAAGTTLPPGSANACHRTQPLPRTSLHLPVEGVRRLRRLLVGSFVRLGLAFFRHSADDTASVQARDSVYLVGPAVFITTRETGFRLVD